MNPFNPFSPVTENRFFFCGKLAEELNLMARQIKTGGYSYAILAGDKMGKTSCLLRLKTILDTDEKHIPHLLNIYLNLSHMMPISPCNFLQGILNESVKELKKNKDFNHIRDEDYKLNENSSIKALFDDFTDNKLKKLIREGEEVYGQIRLVLLIDDAKHLVSGHEWSEAMYHQLRYLFVDSPLSNKISSVLTGFRKIRDLCEQVGSPFNHMQSKFLEGFSREDCRLMLETVFKDVKNINIHLEDEIVEKIHNITGGHPFILTHLYAILWDRIPPVNNMEEAFEELSCVEKNFSSWEKKLDKKDREIYFQLIKHKDRMREEYLKHHFKNKWKESLEVLSSMSLVTWEKEPYVNYRRTFSLFRDWFINNCSEEDFKEEKAIEISDSSAMKFFVYKNGKRHIMGNEACKKIIEEALKGEGAFQLVIDRVFSDGLIIERDRKIHTKLPGKIGMDLLVHLAVNRGIFQSFSQIGYALWQEEFIPKVNIQNVKSIMAKELGKKEINCDEFIISRRGGYIFNEATDVCVIVNAVIRCSKCGNPSDINMNGGRCTNNACGANLI
ncbi:MAG: AAA-like domain-containing protein [Candidatus Eremiobacterota bacterium]